MNCQFCGSKISGKVCQHCGKHQLNKTKRPLFYFLLVVLMIVSGVAVYNYLSKIGTTINLDDSAVPVIMHKADDCNSQFVENELISIFKENDPYFKYIALKSIDFIVVKDKDTLIKDEKNQKYLCSATIEVISDKKGFRPINYDANNPFYKQIHIMEDDLKIKKFTLYDFPVQYVSKILDDKNIVEINNFDIGEFNCKKSCEPVYKIEPKIKHVEKQLIKNKKVSQVNKTATTQANAEKKEVQEQKLPIIQTTEKKKTKKKFRLFGWFRK